VSPSAEPLALPARPGNGRAGLVVASLALAALAVYGLRASLRGGGPELTLEQRLLADDRIDALVYDCGFGKQFDAQTVDMTTTLVSKLERGQRDPLRIAKQELARIGAPAVPALRRLFDRVYSDAFSHGVVENVLAVCALMEGPEGLEILRLGIRHPQETVRLAALDGLRAHGAAGDYDMVLQVLSFAAEGKTQVEYALTLDALDHERFRLDLTQWLEQGLYSATWPYVIDRIADAPDPELVARLARAAELRDETLRPFLIAPAAASGDAEALDELHRMADEGRSDQKQLALRALARIGRGRDGIALLRDENGAVRRAAYGVLVQLDPDEEVTAWLEEGILDADREVSELCLRTLVGRGNAFGRSRALEMLEGTPQQRSSAIGALREAWDLNPGAAEEALQRLLGLLDASSDDASQRLGVLQTLSQVPLREAAEFLLDLGRRTEGEIKGIDAYRFFVGQVWNTGSVGRDLLRAELATEVEPFRRLSLVQWVWQDHEASSRDALLAVVQDVARNPYERLYAADRVIRIGPASVVAPILKQVYQECTHAVVRPALQCLLWTWYGQHFE